ncbi:MAG: hypothetical protein AAGA70_07930 [Pseudomonadota bacterium]
MDNLFKAFLAQSVVILVLAMGPTDAMAQATGASREGPTQLESPTGEVRRFPSVFGAATAFPSPAGSGFAGLTYANPRGGIEGEGPDGDAGAGYTVGNPIENVSLTFGLAITSLEGFGDSGSLSVSAARAISVGPRSLTFAGVSASNLAAWGDAEDSPEAYAAYVSHLRTLRTNSGEIPILLTAGWGDQITIDEDTGAIEEGIFVGVGVGVARNLSVSVSATETQLNTGIGFSIPDLPRISVSMGVFDVTNNVERRQFSLGVSLGF